MTKTATKKRTPSTATSRKGGTRDTTRTPTDGKASYKNPLASMSFEGKIQLNAGQKLVVDDVFEPGSITVVIGEAGSGKTLAAMYAMFKLLKTRDIDKVTITRPTVEAGGRGLGFMPGDIDEKLSVYLQPFMDFCAILGNSGDYAYTDMVAKGTLKGVPLQFMRGITISAGEMIILDEAQNASEEEMLMVLTRAAEGSRVVITGDTRQKDTRHSERSGLTKIVNLAAEKLPFVKVHILTENERSPRINDIITAWDE